MADAFGETMAMLLFVTLLTGGGIYYIVHLQRQRNDLEETVASYQDTARLHTLIYSKIRDIAQLATVEEEFTATISYNADATKKLLGFNLPFSGVNFQMTYEGVILCGCDLASARVPEDSINGNSATIILPHCTVLRCYSKPGSCKIISNESGLLADKITLKQQDQLITADIEREKNHLIREGILQRANENVRSFLKGHMRLIGINPHIVFLSGSDTRLLN